MNDSTIGIGLFNPYGVGVWGGENPQNFSWISKNSDRLFVPVIELNPEVKNSISDMKVSMLTHMRTSWLKRGFFTSCVVKDGTCSE
jgi:hypothetical protein